MQKFKSHTSSLSPCLLQNNCALPVIFYKCNKWHYIAGEMKIYTSLAVAITKEKTQKNSDDTIIKKHKHRLEWCQVDHCQPEINAGPQLGNGSLRSVGQSQVSA